MKASLMRSKAFVFGGIGFVAGLAYGAACFWLGMINPLFHSFEFLAPFLFGGLAYAIGMRQDRLQQQKDKLDQAKDRFTSLVKQAVSQRELGVDFHDAKIPTCWERLNCGASNCPVYGRQHTRCWLVAGTSCRGQMQGRFAQKLKDCTKCEVYQSAIGDDPMREINESFTSLMWVLREKEDDLAQTNSELNAKYGELQQLHEKLKERADRDALTDLYNHGYFQTTLKKEIGRAGRYGRPLSLLMLDLDRFKRVNDQFGHQKGDLVLKSLGALLKRELRDCDCAARYGGEEFMVILPETDGQAATRVAERLRRQMKVVAEEARLPEEYIGVSIGVADFPLCSDDSEGLIAAVDAALLFAKRKGRDRVAFFADLAEVELKNGDLSRLCSRLEDAPISTIQALVEAVDARDLYQPQSSFDAIAASLADKLGLGPEQAQALQLAARFHDIGKIGVPGSVLLKEDELLPEERVLVQRHPEMGRQLLQGITQMRDLITAVLYHHERWDGNGYPEGLKGEQIPLMARVVAIIDAYRAMISDRPYRNALSLPEAVAELRRGAGTQFDPGVVELFVEMLERQEPQMAA